MSVTLFNNAVCAFIIPGVGEGSSLDGLVAPGGTITVADSVADSDFVRNLIDIGDLQETEARADDGDDDINSLREQAGRAGVRVNKTWGKARLLDEIAKAAKTE